MNGIREPHCSPLVFVVIPSGFFRIIWTVDQSTKGDAFLVPGSISMRIVGILYFSSSFQLFHTLKLS
jgi:hypothetical protein